MILSSLLLTTMIHDIKAVHSLVIQAALTGEPIRPILWAQPNPRLLVIRHDRPITARDLPPGLAAEVTHRPYWFPPPGQVVDWAVTVDAGQSGQTRGQWERECAQVAAGTSPRASAKPAPQPRKIHTPARILELITARLAPVLAVHEATAARHTPRKGVRRRDGGRIMWSNQVLLRGTGTVTDAPALHQVMMEGIGRHRSFGCGLILTRPSVREEVSC